MESVAYITSDKVDKLKLEEFREFMRGYTDIFNKKVTLTKDNSYRNLKNFINNKNSFQDILHRDFQDYKHYKENAQKVINQLGYMVWQKLINSVILMININDLKFRPIIDQTNMYAYHAAKVISEYLKPLRSNEYTIRDTQIFAAKIKSLPPLNDDEEDYPTTFSHHSQIFL